MINSSFCELFDSDMKRYNGDTGFYLWRFHFYLRKAQTAKNKYVKRFFHIMLKLCREKHGLEISDEVSIGRGLYLGHPYNITINNHVTIGCNCSIHKGVTIGKENRGIRKGTPTICDNVWIGVNSTIVGNITVGKDVLIAPNSFVNFDVPDHSVVIGNPGIIRKKENAVFGYISFEI